MKVVVVGRDPHEERARRVVRRAGFEISEDHDVPDAVLVAAGPSAPAAPLVARVRSAWPQAPVVVLAAQDTDGDLLASVVAGADGYVRHGVGPSALGRVIGAVVRGEVAISRSCTRTLVEALRRGGHEVPRPDQAPISLTRREWEVAVRLLQDRTTREIADELFVSVATVRTHVAAIVHKLGAADRAGALELLRGA
jgi:DNA-binding NarL/FixJ family response regulator